MPRTSAVLRTPLLTGFSGTMTLTRASDGSISTVTSGNLTITVNRNSDGSISSIVTRFGKLSVTDTVTRDDSGAITSVVKS